MESEIDYTKHTESELVEMFGRLDPRYAPAECARLGRYLTDHGYVVMQGSTGPGSATPSPAKLQTLIGSQHPIEWQVNFGNAGRSLGLGPAQNIFGFVGSGTMQIDGISVWLSGHVSRRGFFSLAEKNAQLSLQQIANVESDGPLVRFGYNVEKEEDDSICLRLPDKSAADKLVAILPKRRTEEFRSQIRADAQFATRLVAQSPRVPVTISLVAINTLVFIATLFAGAELIIPVGKMQVAWGSNFGPYTTDGEWWRLFTSLFIHIGIAHLILNMFALAMFGPLVERLYGSVNYLVIYLLTGLAGSLASISWQPDINSAGASGAIFGILGALVAAQLRGAFPIDIVRPIQNSVLLFLGLSLYAAFKYKGIDNAAHLGGVTAGFLIGLAAARPITNDSSSYSRSDGRRLIQLVAVATGLLAVGFWLAQRASASMVGAGQYWRAVHWISVREPTINGKFNAALSFDANAGGNHTRLIGTLETEVIPFWQEAGDRLAKIQLSKNSSDQSTLELLQDLTDGRADAFQLLENGLRKSDPMVISKANQDLKQIEQTANARRTSRE